MRNLCYFCHFSRGDAKEKSIKIGGSALIAIMLFVFGGSVQVSTAAERTSEILAGLIPEPGYLIAAELAQEQGQTAVESIQSSATAPAPEVAPVKETCRVDGVEMPGPCSNYPPQGELQEVRVEEQKPEMNDEEREQMDRQNLERWKQDRLREWRDQLREIANVRRQLRRLKGSQDDVAKLDAMETRIKGCQNQLNAAAEVDDMKDVLEGEECGDTGDLWEEINRIRQAVELPRELNRIMLELKRLERIVVLKWAKKITDLTPVVAEMKARYAEAKAAYQAGEYEDAMEIIRENFHEKGNPGECQHALNLLRGFIESSRRVKDQELKGELEGLIEPVKEALAQGECRDARESAEAIQHELGPQIFKLILDNERRRKALPSDLDDRIERVRQKFGEIESHPEGEVKPVQ